MSLNQLVLDKIQSIGLKEASIYFGKSEATIRTWVNKKTATVESVEKVLADQKEAPSAPPKIEQETDVVAVNALHDNEHDQIWEKLNDLNKRMSGIENALRMERGLPPLPSNIQNSAVMPHAPIVQNQPATPPTMVPPPQAQEPGSWLRPHRNVSRN